MKGFLLDENFDITNNIGDVTEQTITLALLTSKGAIKYAPHAGVDLAACLKSSKPKIEARIKKELRIDGAIVRNVNINDSGNINVDAIWQ